MPRPARFTRDDWAAAALALLSEGGPAAVAVEPAAARLGASKSSFYWLFPNRQALLEAALLTWEQQQTDAVLPGLAAIADPAERLRRLARAAFAATQPADLALRLLTETEPLVRPSLSASPSGVSPSSKQPSPNWASPPPRPTTTQTPSTPPTWAPPPSAGPTPPPPTRTATSPPC